MVDVYGTLDDKGVQWPKKYQIDAAIRQLVSKAITTEGEVIDVFTAAGLKRPDISILSDGFLAEVHREVARDAGIELGHGVWFA